MKTTYKTLIGAILIATTCIPTPAFAAAKATTQHGWFSRTFSKLDWNELPSVVSTPKDICKKVRSQVEFRTEEGDTWSSGAETWKRGWGDCEDLAACVTDLCHALKIDATILVFKSRGSREAHAVAMGVYEGQLWISSNGWYSTVQDLDEAKATIADEMGWDLDHVTITTLDKVH